MLRSLLPALLVLAMVGCDSDSPTDPVPDGPLEIQPLAKVSQSGYAAAQRTVLRSTGEWADAWQRLHEGLQPVPPRPNVDFNRSFVVLAAAGTRPDGCYSIEITRVRPSIEGQPVFDVVESKPGPDCACPAVITRPAHVVRVTSFSGDAEYLEFEEELAC